MYFNNIDYPVLGYLSEKRFISIKEISNELGVSCNEVLIQIQELKKYGYRFLTHSVNKYRIIFRPDALLPQEIIHTLNTRKIGRKIYYFNEVDSTNIVARKIIRNGGMKTDDGTVIIAEKQIKGKGRLDRNWISPEGGLWFSVILNPTIDLLYLPLITLMSSVIVTRIIRNFYQINAKIKWPNDILIDNKKICGILTETSISSNSLDYVIVGIGLNVNISIEDFPENIINNTISLKSIIGENISRKRILIGILEEFEKYYETFKKSNFTSIINEWKLYSGTIGSKVSINTGRNVITGKAIDIDKNGGLILKMKNGDCEKVMSGTIIR